MNSLFVLPNLPINSLHGSENFGKHRLSRLSAFDCNASEESDCSSSGGSDGEMDELPVPARGLTGSRKEAFGEGGREPPVLGGSLNGTKDALTLTDAPPQTAPLMIPIAPEGASASPSRRDTAVSLSLPLDYYFASPGSGGPVSASGSSVSGSAPSVSSSASSPMRDLGFASDAAAAERYMGSYETGGIVEEEMRALEAQLMGSPAPAPSSATTGAAHRVVKGETWLNSSDEDKRIPVPATAATSAHREAHEHRAGSVLSSPTSEYSSRLSSAVHSNHPQDAATRYNEDGTDSASDSPHAMAVPRPAPSSHHHHRRIHVVDIPTSSSESSLGDAASRASSPTPSSEQSFGNVGFPYRDLIRHERDGADDLSGDVFGGEAHAHDSAMDPSEGEAEAEADNEGTPSPHVLEGRRYKMWARKERTSIASSSGSAGTARPVVEDGPITPGRHRGGHARGSSGGRLAFVAPSDLSSRSLEDLQRRLSATDEQEGTGKLAQSTNRQDGNASAPAYRTTFRVDDAPKRRLSDDETPSTNQGDVSPTSRSPRSFKSPKLVTPKARQEAELKRTVISPGRGGAGAATTPKQPEPRVEATPRGPRSSEKFRSVGSPTDGVMAASPRSPAGNAVTTVQTDAPLMGLGFGEEVSASRIRGVSPDPPPRSGLRRKSARMANFAEYLEAGSGSASEGEVPSSRSSLSLEGIPSNAQASAVTASNGISVPPQRISSRNAAITPGTLTSYNTSSSLSSSDMGSPPAVEAPTTARPFATGMYQQRSVRDSVASLALENLANAKGASPGNNRISFSSMRRPASLLSMRSTNSSLLKVPQKQHSFSSAQSRPWPAAMVMGHVKSIKNPGDRAREYAKATNALLQTDTGMAAWYSMAKARSTPPVHGSRARQRSKMSAAQSLGVGLAPVVASQLREVSGMSIRSDASFPTRLDAGMATEIDFREVDPLDPPDALPPLPYPQAQLAASHGSMKPSVSTHSVKSLGNALGGGFFAALGRRGSSKHPRNEVSPRRIGFPVPHDSGPASSASKRSLDLGGARQTSVPAPMGPRDRMGATFSQPLQDARASLDSRMPPAEGSYQHRDQLRKQSAPASTQAAYGNHQSEDLERMMEVLPTADPHILAQYLTRHGDQVTAIGAYIEDERANRLPARKRVM